MSAYCLISFFLYFLPKINGFNPCNIDDSICMPLEDFQENCTCILLPDDQLFNVTDEVYLFMTGYPIHMSYIQQSELQPLFRKKLSVRIPQLFYYQSNSDFNENVYRSMKIVEKVALFEADSSKSSEVLKYLNDNQYILTKSLSTSENRWCLEGECNAFNYESDIVNKSIGLYSHKADLLQIIDYRGRSIFAISSVLGEFSVPTAKTLQCQNKCKLFRWSENEMCQRQCKLRLDFDQISVTSDLKRNFDFFVQSSAIYNIREKYKKYIDSFPRN